MSWIGSKGLMESKWVAGKYFALLSSTCPRQQWANQEGIMKNRARYIVYRTGNREKRDEGERKSMPSLDEQCKRVLGFPRLMNST